MRRMNVTSPGLRVALLPLAFAMLACAPATSGTASDDGTPTPPCTTPRTEPWPPTVSIIDLLARPAEFDGKRVQVIGYVHLEFEGMGIYLHQEDYEYGITKNGLWLSFGPSSSSLCPFEGPQDRYMIVQGTFQSDRRGHLGLWSGTLADISRFDRWMDAPPPPRRP